MKFKIKHISMFVAVFLFLLFGSCDSSVDFNGKYATELCPYFEYTNLNPTLNIYMEGGKQFIEFNGATYVGEMEGKKLNFFQSPGNIPYSLEKNNNGKFVLNPYQCVYSKI